MYVFVCVHQKSEYWRLRDDQGKPPGLIGWWPSRAVTFIENHDTGSTQGHWRFPDHGVEQGYVYILTHPGTPTVCFSCIFKDLGGVYEPVVFYSLFAYPCTFGLTRVCQVIAHQPVIMNGHIIWIRCH